MKLTCVTILKYNGPDKDAHILGIAADLSTFGYFQRGTVKEMLTFVSRTIARRTQVGQRQTVQQDEYYCHVFNRDGLVGIAFVDEDYPARAGFCIVNKVLEDFSLQHGDKWRGVTADTQDAQTIVEAALEKYQVCPPVRLLFYLLYHDACGSFALAGGSVVAMKIPDLLGKKPTEVHHPRFPPCLLPQDPAQADKLQKIQRDLDETKIILHKTIESVLDRGEKLDHLVDKSADLSMASQLFYKQARKANSCCRFM